MKKFHLKLTLIAALFCAAIFLFVFQQNLTQKEISLEVHFLSVGQGDAVFIEAPNGTQMLVDAGPDETVLREISKVVPFWDRTIDVLVATHPDMDHIGGFPEIFKRFAIETVVDTGVTSDTGIYDAYKKNRDLSGASQVLASAGEVVVLDKENGVFVEILFPGEEVDQISDKNDTSIILRVVYGEHEILLTGDASKKIEKYLVSRYGNRLQSDVLKLGHHGSKTSTDEDFLRVVSPDVVVVSAGAENRYGHPHQEVLDLIQYNGIQLRSTAEGVVSFSFK